MLKLNNANVDRGVLNITVDSVKYALLPHCETNEMFINRLSECENVEHANFTDKEIIITWCSTDDVNDNIVIVRKFTNDDTNFSMVKNTFYKKGNTYGRI